MRLLFLMVFSGLPWAALAAPQHAEHAEHAEQHHHAHTSMPTSPDQLRDPFAWSAPDATVSHAHDAMLQSALHVDALQWSAQTQQLTLQASAWIGDHQRRIVLRSDLEHQSSHTDQQWSVHAWRPLDPFWNLEAGLAWEDRADAAQSQTWLSVGVSGLAPYWVDSGAWLLIDQEGYSKLQLSAAYDLRLTQDWLLTPELSLTGYGKDRPAQHEWAGLAQLNMDLRLGYQRQRLWIPYVGLTYQQALGNTAKHSRDDHDAWQGVLGVRFWY